jgi:hypothetical protein
MLAAGVRDSERKWKELHSRDEDGLVLSIWKGKEDRQWGEG